MMGTALRAKSENNNNNNNNHEKDKRSSTPDNKEQLRNKKPTFTFHVETLMDGLIDMDPISHPFIYSVPLLPSWDPIESLYYITPEDDDCVGGDNDCDDEECTIPEEYKTVQGAASFDVMAYLGISRAEPIRVKEGYDSVWE